MDTAIQVPPGTARPPRTDPLRWVIGLPLLRIALVAAASALAWILVGLTVGWTPFPPSALLATVAILPVNIVCFVLVRARLRAEGRTVGDLIGFRRGRLGRDVLWGLLWLVVLYVPFALTIMLTMWALHGSRMYEAFETVFFDAEALPALNPTVIAVLAVIAVLTFAPLNAPTEELVYRGYSQGALAQRWRIAPAILVPAVLFGLQHVWFAPTRDAVIVYACAFFVWGVGSGIIARRQGRLLPLVIAHGLVNLFTTLPALAIPFLLANGAP